MGFKRLLGVISVVILVMFTLMLTTSYAWYSFEKGSTTFDVVTNNDDIVVSFHKGEYINTSIAVPIASADVDQYSEKNNFSIRVKDNAEDNEMMVTISLAEISIDGALQNANFKVYLYQQNTRVATVAGNTIGTSGATTKTLGTVTLDDDIDNNFELRVYLLDDGTDQSVMMNKTFQAKIKINVVSRLKSTINDYSDPDILVSSVTIDGVASDSLPTSGYYTMSSTCTKGSSLSWEPLSKTITYASGSKVNDSCSLTFTSNTNYPLLNTMEPGSYVKYTGSNGCEGKSCQGQNANYVSDADMGYCSDSGTKFITNGWRIGYIEGGNVYLVSAGAPECMCTNSSGISSNSSCSSSLASYDKLSLHYNNLDAVALKYCNANYANDGICDNTTAWAMDATDFQKITGNALSSSSCYYSASNRTCGYNNDLIDNGSDYWFASAYNTSFTTTFVWWSNYRAVDIYASAGILGVRPILYLDSSVFVTGGTGTYEDPYTISISS